MRPPLAKDPIAEIQNNWQRQGWHDAAAPAAAVTAIMRNPSRSRCPAPRRSCSPTVSPSPAMR